MRIAKIVVNNYRSIEKAEVEISKFSIFVGQNNHGKTNFFEAIEWFYTAKSSKTDEHFGRSEENRISVEIFFEDVIATDIEKLTVEGNKTKIRTMLDGATTFSVLKTSADHK